MTVQRTATIVAAGGALIAWLAAAASSGGRRSVDSPLISVPPLDSRTTALASEIARLHERLRPNEAPRQPARNLFAFGAAPARPATPAASLPSEGIDRALLRPARPALKLSGLAEDATPDGIVRTAIISAPGQLFLAREGQTVAERYRVVRISADVVELSDLDDDSIVRLALP
jgi:uncharacterized small protein (DUF1192 family)